MKLHLKPQNLHFHLKTSFMTKTMSILPLIFLLSMSSFGQVSIHPGGLPPHPSAMLDINVLPGSPRGVLIPRMLKANRNAIPDPEFGLLVFQTGPDSTGFHYYNGVSWIWLSSQNQAWSTTGNIGTSSLNFIGTRDNEAFRIKQNNNPAGLLDGTKLNSFWGVNTSTGALPGISNNAFGAGALKLLSSGSGNIAIGVGTLGLLNTENRNIAIGDSAMSSYTNSAAGFSNNVVIGPNAYKTPNAGVNNTLVGNSVMEMAIGDRRFNTALGDRAMSSGTGGDQNIAIGHKALDNISGGNKNVVIGTEAGLDLGASSRNIAIGTRALFKQTTSGQSIAIGDSALASYNSNSFANTNNTAIGTGAMANLTNGVSNTVIGHGAMATAASDSRFNVAIGMDALADGANNDYNVSIGYKSMEMATGRDAIAIGGLAMSLGTIGDGTVGIGFRSLESNSASGNTAIGYLSLNQNSTGAYNTAVGYEALKNNQTFGGNTAVGNGSLMANNSAFNTAVGFSSVPIATDAFRNVSIGAYTHNGLTTGDNNIAIGYNADVTTGTLTNTVVLGYSMNVSTSNTMVLGNSSTEKWAFGLTSTGLAKAIEVGNNVTNGNGAYLTIGGVWTNTSDVNKKEDFTALNGTEILEKVAALDVSRWRYKGSNEYHIGPNAQNFYQLFQTGTDNLAISSIDPSGVALAAIQELIRQNKLLQEQVDELKKRIDGEK
jgi:trimeric autotransporter adhesin